MMSAQTPEQRFWPRIPGGVPLVTATLVATTLIGAGCNTLDSFTTAPGEAYCGQITLGSGYRMGFSPRVQLRLKFDAGTISNGASPGTLSSYDSGGSTTDPVRLLDESVLRPIPPLSHDSLSQLEFGDGREKNLIYAVTPTDPQAEGLLAVVSLRSDDLVEVRLIRAGVTATDDSELAAGRVPLFGVFILERHDGNCGF
jgi:hypothetical protein